MSGTSGHSKLKRTILVRTGGVMVMLIIGILVASSIFVISEQRDDEKQQALGMARFLADQATQLSLWDKPQDLKAFLTQMTNLHFTYQYVVVEQNDAIVFHTMPAELTHRLAHQDDEVTETGFVRTVKDTDGNAIYDAAVANSSHSAVVHVGVARGPIGEHTSATLKSIAAGSVFALLLSVGLAWMVAWMTTREVAAAELAVRESEERYRYLFEHSPDSIMLMRLTGDGPPVIIDCNEATCRMHGYTRDEIIGSYISKLDSEEDRAKIPDRAKRIMAGEVISFEGEHVRKDGSHFPVEVVARMVEIGGESVLQGIDRDISERKQAEEEKRSLEAQLVQAQKMDAIGRLAGGIAHDMNNILGSILGAASLLEDETDDELLQEHLDKIVFACRRGRDFTRNFLGYARKGSFVKETINLNHLIQDTVGLLTHTIPKKIAIEADLEADLHCVRGDSSLVGQALMNVCLNAVDAMEGQGTLRFESSNFVVEEDDPTALHDLQPGMYAQVTVRDTGGGMDEETINKVFEPFFTTKPGSKGTGLGLSMVHGTMLSHDGEVSIDSKPGVGTAVRLLIPATSDLPCEAESDVPSTVEEIDLEGVVVLLVEDEQLLRHVGREMLTKFGCAVIEAENGRVALEEFARHRNEVSLVILDLVMPEMDGSETFHELRKIDPDLRILISSGFTNDEVVDELLASGATGFVEKPFDMRALKEVVMKALQADH